MNAIVVVIWVRHVEDSVVIVIGVGAVWRTVVVVVGVKEVRNQIAVQVTVNDCCKGRDAVRGIRGDRWGVGCVDPVEFCVEEIDAA